MTIPANHLKRYQEIGLLLWKYGRSDLVQQLGIDEAVDPQEAKAAGAKRAPPEQLADDLEAMGPTYVKLGQVLSGRPDLLPDPYLKALARLQDKVKPFPYAEVEPIVATELGVRISQAFSRFDTTPIAAASLGQVHSAALRDGRLVVVKVQRPNIRKQITEDFEVLEQIAEFLDAHTELGRRHRFLKILEEFRITIQQELNYEREAQNLIALGANLKEFELIPVPQPISDYSTRSVLTMDYGRARNRSSTNFLTASPSRTRSSCGAWGNCWVPTSCRGIGSRPCQMAIGFFPPCWPPFAVPGKASPLKPTSIGQAKSAGNFPRHCASVPARA